MERGREYIADGMIEQIEEVLNLNSDEFEEYMKMLSSHIDVRAQHLANWLKGKRRG